MEASANKNNVSDRTFGVFFCGVFLLAAFYCYSQQSLNLTIVFLFLSVTFGLVAALNPILLRKPNLWWMKLGLNLGRLFSPLILALMYFALISPVGMLMKVFGRDELILKTGHRSKGSGGRSTYWFKAMPNEKWGKDFTKQF